MKQMVKLGLCLIVGLAGSAMAQEAARGQFRGASTAVRFDVSPPLRTIAPLPPADRDPGWYGSLMVDPDSGRKPRDNNAPDGRAQTMLPSCARCRRPGVSFDAGSGTANPPDPVGDVGPNHYVRMANASFQIFSKTGTSMFGPAAINTLFTGFGGACEAENAGDPVVIYDQLADRWLLSQFSDSSGPGFFNCVALSTSGNPLGTWYRWAFATNTFPDYPKYGMWPNAFLISTREVNAGLIGAYAIDRTQMLAGNALPRMVQFTVPVDAYSGDGLLPADLDGNALPPAGAPVYFLGAMDNGGPYGATQDALALWEFDIDFDTPAASTFQVVKTIPIAPYDTNFPCSDRSCMPQPAPLGAVDILSYRQRPTFRAAYRNFGSYQSIVATQSVEGAPSMAGMRWWEIRAPGASAELYQDSTYVPGATDGIHRWMGSIAQDRSGNIGLGYSASSASVYPDVRYSGRLEADPLNELGQGEGTLVTAAGGHTASTRRWGDYTALTVDPTDDCTFWYVNQYFVTSGTTWTLRVGSFKFPDCGMPNLGIATSPLTQSGCVGSDISIGVQAHAYDGFNSPATLSVSGVPAGMTSSFAPADHRHHPRHLDLDPRQYRHHRTGHLHRPGFGHDHRASTGRARVRPASPCSRPLRQHRPRSHRRPAPSNRTSLRTSAGLAWRTPRATSLNWRPTPPSPISYTPARASAAPVMRCRSRSPAQARTTGASAPATAAGPQRLRSRASPRAPHPAPVPWASSC